MPNIIDPHFRFFRWLLAALLLLSTTGCVSTHLPPISVQGAAYVPLDDEIDLWQSSRDEESYLLQDVAVIDDPDLDLYLEQMVDRLQSPGMAANREVHIQVRVLDDPNFNAFAYPHGSIYITSGLLDQVETEDQLAGILAHEITHVENRHMARHERARWNQMVPIGVLTLATSIALSIEEEDAWEDGDYEDAEILGELSEAVFFAGFALAERVSARGYGRRLEIEADEGMVQKLHANYYDVGSVMSFYDRLGGIADSPAALAHGLGPDAAKRLKAVVGPANGSSLPTDGPRPLLPPAELRALLRGDRGSH